MKKFLSLFLAILILAGCFSSCTSTDSAEPVTTLSAQDENASKFVGKWYNTFSTSDTPDFEIKADGTLIYNGTTNGTWSEKNEEIIISLILNEKPTTMTGYFVISGEGFVARATEENMHYIDEGKGELQLEFMLTEKTCVDCVKKD